MGLIAWFRQQRQWRREHVAAFAVVTKKGPNGLSLFQEEAISAVEPFVTPAQYQRVSAKDPCGKFVVLVAPLGTEGHELYIYPNEAAISGKKPYSWFEEWDYRTPTELLNALVKECASRAA